jgi:hypothetical protein
MQRKPAANIPIPLIARHHRAAFRLNLALYIVFFALIAPMANWADMLVGARFDRADIFLTPFAEGRFYAYAIFLSAQSMFVYFLFLALVGRSPAAISFTLANLVIFVACLLDYLTSYRLAVVTPAQQTTLSVGNQIVFSLLSMIFGYTIHHHLTSREELIPALSLAKD